jgi:hypothetical protein
MILAKRRRRCVFSERMKKTRSRTQTAAGFETGHVAEAENSGQTSCRYHPQRFHAFPNELLLSQQWERPGSQFLKNVQQVRGDKCWTMERLIIQHDSTHGRSGCQLD